MLWYAIHRVNYPVIMLCYSQIVAMAAKLSALQLRENSIEPGTVLPFFSTHYQLEMQGPLIIN